MKSLKILLNFYYPPNKIHQTLVENSRHLYIPINSGSNLLHYNSWCDSHLIYDSQLKNNISQLNPKLNEMTGIYACWKNYSSFSSPEYIGFNHYRRLFDPHDFSDYKQFDIIIGKPIRFLTTMADQYARVHHKTDFDILVSLLKRSQNAADIKEFTMFPQLYAPCNMFIMKKDLFFKYCEFIFDKLFFLINSIIVDTHDRYQSRALAFLSERLTSFWMIQQMKQQNKKIKEIPIVLFKEWKP